jgi:hypothetical protein
MNAGGGDGSSSSEALLEIVKEGGCDNQTKLKTMTERNNETVALNTEDTTHTIKNEDCASSSCNIDHFKTESQELAGSFDGSRDKHCWIFSKIT